MENSKKIIIFIIFLLTVTSCKYLKKENLTDCFNCENLKDSIIFRDNKTNDFYIRIKSVDLHPSLINKLIANNYYSYYKFLFV